MRRIYPLLTASLVLVGCDAATTSTVPMVRREPATPPVPTVAADYYAPLGQGGLRIDGNNGVPLTFVDCAAATVADATACVESVTVNGAPGTVADLAKGRMAEIHGSRRNWTLTSDSIDATRRVRIDVQHAVVGPIESVDSIRREWVVMGQRVYYTFETIFGDANDVWAYDMAPGTMVAVSGHFTPDGQVLATRIDPVPDGSPLLVRGVLANAANGHFRIGSLVVDVAAAARERFPAGAPLVGDAAIVLAHQLPVEGVLTAATIRCTGSCASDDWDMTGLGFVNGILTAWRSWFDYEVDGHPIQGVVCECAYGPPPPVGSLIELDFLSQELRATQPVQFGD